MLAEQRQPKLHVAQAQARGIGVEGAHLVGVATVDTRKGVQARAANRQHIHRDARRRFVDGGRARNVAGQFDVLAGLAHRQIALNRHKAVHVDVQESAGLQQLALGTIHGECEAAARSGADRQICFVVGIVHHQRALGFGCNVGDRARLSHL